MYPMNGNSDEKNSGFLFAIQTHNSWSSEDQAGSVFHHSWASSEYAICAIRGSDSQPSYVNAIPLVLALAGEMLYQVDQCALSQLYRMYERRYVKSSTPDSTSTLTMIEVGGRHDIPADMGRVWTQTSAEVSGDFLSRYNPLSVIETDGDQVTPSSFSVGANLILMESLEKYCACMVAAIEDNAPNRNAKLVRRRI
jgi:hypothetical protein